MKREELAKIGEKLTVDIGNKILETTKNWLDSHDKEYPDSVLVAAVLTGVVLAYETLAGSLNIPDGGYALLHEFVMKARNREK